MNHYLVYLDEHGMSIATTRKGSISKRCKELVAEYAHMEHGLWDASEDMGETYQEVDKNIRRAITARLQERKEKVEAFRQQLQAEHLAKRKAAAFTKDKMLIKPFDLMQHAEGAAILLERLKPGTYCVCVNYKHQGYVELKPTARGCFSLKVLATVEREDKPSQAALMRFTASVRNAYKKGTELIGRTHAIKSFGQKLTDSIPHVMERKNPHYASAAPSRLYDRQTLLYLQVMEAEKHIEAQ